VGGMISLEANIMAKEESSRSTCLPAVNSLTEMACMAYISGELQNSQIVHGWICAYNTPVSGRRSCNLRNALESQAEMSFLNIKSLIGLVEGTHGGIVLASLPGTAGVYVTPLS